MEQPNLTSPSFPGGSGTLRRLAEVRAKRAAIEAQMREEGSPQAMIDRLATDDTASKMIAHEDQCVGMIMRMIGGRL